MRRACLARAWLLAALLAAGAAAEPGLRGIEVTQSMEVALDVIGPVIRASTLNIAHGRDDSLNQLLVSASRTRANLEAIGRFLMDRRIDIAALQEVDAPSWWSGGFDQASVVAAAGAFSYRVQASHAHLLIASYGTAILSRLPIREAAAVDFAPSPPTAGKGFTIAQINWQVSESTQVTLDVVSIHMDFSRASVRESQLAELEAVLETRHNPLLIMGDFNSQDLAQRLVDAAAANDRRLHTAEDDGGVHTTYKGKRLDWIIASGELEFVDYHTDATMLSDHRAVIASIALRDNPEE